MEGNALKGSAIVSASALLPQLGGNHVMSMVVLVCGLVLLTTLAVSSVLARK